MDNYLEQVYLNYEKSTQFLSNLSEAEYGIISFDEKKYSIILEDHTREKILDFRLPLPLKSLRGFESLDDYLLELPSFLPNYLIILVQAGTAAFGYFEEGIIDSHKVIRKYMIRAKQGKAQIKHLKTKGKSRLGSRIRLAQTDQFFEEINDKLLEWEIEDVDRVLYNASIQLWNLVFESRILPPFEKDDERLCKIPLDIHRPSYEELLKVNDYIQQGRLRIYKPNSIDLELQ